MKSCPSCKTGAVSVQPAMTAKPIGDFSLAGAQMKLSVAARWVATCDNDACPFAAYGHLEDAEYDPTTGTFTAGHFVAD